ncbi:NB-ARC domain-containing protein [Nonomuraea insulae]|uniref:NB-ARC domain-containing protein n=1 Tax=Nonomuraea insulae TaxID=1616787 RepID=A0ABW1CKT7_9ACTN
MDPGAGMSLGALLRMWRRRALLTQEQVAERAGLNVRTVRRLENNGLLRPRATSVLLLAKALELSRGERATLNAVARGRPTPTDPAEPAEPASPASPASSASPAPSAEPVAHGWPAATDADTHGWPPPLGHVELAVGVGGPRPWAVPRQLPADIAAPAVRERELAIVLDRHGVVCVNGMAGMGKTALAVHAAHQLAPLFPDGQLFVDLHAHARTEPVEPGAALARVLRALGVPEEHIPSHLDDRAALYRSVLAGRKILVVLDDAADEHQLRPLLPAAPDCRVIITSRRRLTFPDDARILSLDVLPVTEAIALFTRVAGREQDADTLTRKQDADTPAREQDADTPADVLAEVVRRCGLLPLAIRIAAARLRAHPAWNVWHLLDRLAGDRLAELTAGGHSVAAALDRSYERLPAEQQRAYRLLGSAVRPDLGLDAAAALLGTTTMGARRLLDHLLDAHLLQEPAPGRYRLHSLVHAHASALWLTNGVKSRGAPPSPTFLSFTAAMNCPTT